MDLLNLTTTTTTTTTTITTDLYCSEDAGDLSSSPAPSSPQHHQPVVLLSPDNTTPILSLLSSEHSFLPSPPHLLSLHPSLLHHSISYILKVSDLLQFRPVTPYLAINYLHRFLSSHSLPGQSGKNGGGWALQLLTVACLSVAMKMVETHVPHLMDLQVFEPRFVFEPRTVRRMELLLMASLRWRMRAITPFDFLDFASSSGFSSDARRCAGELIVNTSRVVEFLGFPPSVIAAAAIVCAQRGDSSAVHDDDLLGFLGDSLCKETVMGCCQLMHQYLIDTCPSSFGGKPCSEPIAPRSPSGVLDAVTYVACSSDKSSSSASLAEPAHKRRRIGHR